MCALKTRPILNGSALPAAFAMPRLMRGYGQWYLTSRWKDVAKSVKQGDIVMYSYDGCVPASRAREHFRKYKIEFTECDIQKNEKCYRMLKLLNTEGIPAFVIYDKHMLQGFSENALYEALTKKK